MTTPSKAVSTAETPISNTIPQELIVIIDYKGWDITEYLGTRVMLEAEGIIPPGTEWLEGYFDLRQKDEKFRYWLRRRRPPEAKGSRKQFENVDWFCLRWELLNSPNAEERQIARKKKELDHTIYHHSTQGRKEWSVRVRYERLREAERDMQFQAFKAKIPGLVPIKRGRGTAAKEA